jgi:predicted nicotinamide N-methyase
MLNGEGAIDEGNGSTGDNITELLSKVRDHFDVQEKEEIFKIRLRSASNDPSSSSRSLRFELKGFKQELGQTLPSTGLTIWRAAEKLSQFLFDRPDLTEGKTVVELGCGLGLIAIQV